MRNEGKVPIEMKRFGPLAALRAKQWWYFEGLDPEQQLYFVFLALEAFPASYVSLKLIDYRSGERWTEDHLGSFQAKPGDCVDISAQGGWGNVRFQGQAEDGWQIDVQTLHVQASCVQQPRAEMHRNWLLTQHIDYTIQQFVMNRCQGTVALNGRSVPFQGYGYHEHNWGVQPRHSTAHWLHFWTPDSAGVILSCFYDAGVPHHYSFLWREKEYPLHSPAEFTFDPAHPMQPWEVKSPDLQLAIQPITAHHTRMQIPPLLGYINVDYYEQLLSVRGTAWVHGGPLSIDGIGKLDHNWNCW